ncbi:PepSY-associated TM helix domain-containing protein [Hymenobacter convexus]|uniref:PepSY-associated TM helix domain-containing protein n=1 Tax=Hymenobacter sp. CA1UV-4 TaxID=3063782 RepID=UPI002713BB48|nr:PepSY-associated TM helix domain-containing protein [Hymenobacter sp. CA1UV-4]MDO7854203.1 PepSY-associated TM helix domain-containing protein [Hymenobacter sp. CA1UV-4]
MTPLKSAFRTIHLWLGLASGLVIVWVCLTGCVLAFEKELEQSWHSERYFVAPAGTPRLALAQVAEAVRAHKPKAKISGLKVYADPTRTVEVSLAGAPEGGKGGEGRRAGAEPEGGAKRVPGEGPGKDGKGGKGRGEGGGPRVFVNPYTAAITGELNPRDNFFKTVEQLHRGLVAGKIGKLVTGISASMFLFILATGIVLWWPAARKAFSARLKVKWGSGWKRLNHDFHIVLGFYASVFLFVIALTGVGMSFDWVGEGINRLTHSPTKRPEAPESAAPAGAAPFAADAVLALARQQAPDAESYALQLPKDAKGSIRVAVLRPGAITDNATDEVYLDQYSGQVISGQTYAQRPVGQRIRGLFKPVHTGAIFGWPTKVLALLMTLLGATFPVTGTIMWLNRWRKQQRKRRPLEAVAS